MAGQAIPCPACQKSILIPSNNQAKWRAVLNIAVTRWKRIRTAAITGSFYRGIRPARSGETSSQPLLPVFDITCPKCGSVLEAEDKIVGTKSPCPRCGLTLLIHRPQSPSGLSPTAIQPAIVPVQETAGWDCPSCGATMAITARFCANCGKPIAAPAINKLQLKLSCPDCGMPMGRDEVYCGGCGANRLTGQRANKTPNNQDRIGTSPGWNRTPVDQTPPDTSYDYKVLIRAVSILVILILGYYRYFSKPSYSKNSGVSAHYTCTVNGSILEARGVYPYSTDDDNIRLILKDIWTAVHNNPTATGLRFTIVTAGQNHYGESTTVNRGVFERDANEIQDIRHYVSADAYAQNDFGGGVYIAALFQ